MVFGRCARRTAGQCCWSACSVAHFKPWDPRWQRSVLIPHSRWLPRTDSRRTFILGFFGGLPAAPITFTPPSGIDGLASSASNFGGTLAKAEVHAVSGGTSAMARRRRLGSAAQSQSRPEGQRFTETGSPQALKVMQRRSGRTDRAHLPAGNEVASP